MIIHNYGDGNVRVKGRSDDPGLIIPKGGTVRVREGLQEPEVTVLSDGTFQIVWPKPVKLVV